MTTAWTVWLGSVATSAPAAGSTATACGTCPPSSTPSPASSSPAASTPPASWYTACSPQSLRVPGRLPGSADDPIEKQRYLTAHAPPDSSPATPPKPRTPMRPTPAGPNMWWSSMPTPPDSQARSPSSPSPSRSPPACSPPSPATPTSTPSSSATASSCTPPANSTSAAPHDSPTEPNDAHFAASTATAPSPAAPSAYDRCKLHHIIWWRNQGRTDLHNLLPVCNIHHTKIHHDRWTIELGPNRELTLRPPRRQHPHHRPTQPTNRRLTRNGPGTSKRRQRAVDPTATPRAASSWRCCLCMFQRSSDVELTTVFPAASRSSSTRSPAGRSIVEASTANNPCPLGEAATPQGSTTLARPSTNS